MTRNDPLPGSQSGQNGQSGLSHAGLSGFDILRGSTAGGETPSEPPAPRPGMLPPRLRELDLTLAPERARVVDSLEIAAYLEADGYNDEGLRDRYGAGGLFQAAEMLYVERGTGRALTQPPAQSIPVFPWAMLQRGVLYFLPGVVGLLSTAPLGQVSSVGFAFAAAFGWGYSMLIASIRYADPFGVPGRALRGALLIGTVAGMLGGLLVSLLVLGLTALNVQQVGLTLLASGVIGLACSASGILLALGRPVLFGGAFAVPLLLSGMVYVLASPALALVCLGALGLFPLLAALHATRTPGALVLNWALLRRGLPLAAYGWAMAATFVALTARLGGWALLPVVVSAGLLEAGVWHAQERLQHASRVLYDLAGLVRRGAAVVLLVALAYGLVLAACVALMMLWPQLAGTIPAAALVAVPALGTAFLLSAWLANQRREVLLLGIWLLAALLMVFRPLPPELTAVLVVFLLIPSLFSALNDPRSYR